MRGKRMTIVLGEADHWRRAPLYLAILERLKALGCAGATVTRGIAGFGAHSRIRTTRLVDVPMDPPIVITVIDRPDRIERCADEVASMMAAGAIAIDDVEVHFYSAAFKGGLPDVEVRHVMSETPDMVSPDTPLVEVVQRLVERAYTVLPVVDDDRHVIGMIGDHDLLARGWMSETLQLQRAAGPEALHATLRSLTSSGGTARDAMATPALTVRQAAHLPDVARLMHERHLKRVPVVDDTDRLVGVVSRFDVLRAIAEGFTGRTAPRTVRLPQEHRTVGEIMEREVPTVAETMPLGEVLERLLASVAEEVVVLDAAGNPTGIITDANLLARVDPAERPGLLTMLRSRWNTDAERRVRRSLGRRAADIMATPVITVQDTEPVMAALILSATRHLKRVPVVAADGRLVGVVARPALLAASLDIAGDEHAGEGGSPGDR